MPHSARIVQAHRRYLKLHAAAQAKFVYLRSKGKIHLVARFKAEIGLRVREKNALKLRALVADRKAQVLSTADRRYLIEPCAEDTHRWLRVSAAVRLKARERVHTLHVKNSGVCYADIAAQRRKLRRLVVFVIFAERAAELPELIALYIKPGRKRVSAEALEIFRACRQRVEQIKAAVAAARSPLPLSPSRQVMIVGF